MMSVTIDRMTPLALLVTLASIACAASPAAPAPVSPAPRTGPTTILLAGQSNAVQLRPSLEALYTIGTVDGYAYGGTEIGQWLTEDPWTWATFSFSPWTLLKPTLHQPAPVRALIWWQGESDARDPYRPDPHGYRSQLVLFLSRVRAETAQPDLMVIICQILDDPADDTTEIRAQIAAYVQGDRHARLVLADDLPRADAQHLTREGYERMAGRVIAALPGR